MSTMVASYLLTGLTAGAGFAAVFFPLQMAVRRWLHEDALPPTNPPEPDSSQAPATLPADQAQELVMRLHDVAVRMARDVGLHNESMREINADLETVDPTDAGAAIEIVLSAVDKIAQANGRLTEQLTSAEDTIRKQSELLDAQMEDALTDPLTEIANRRALDHELSRRLTDWQRCQAPVALLMLDVDHFKRFNDTHGHQAGDEVLRGVGRVLTETMREMDLVSRYGGEEFAVVLPATDLEAAKLAAERAREAIAAEAFQFEGTELHVTVSVGVAQVRAEDDAAALIGNADEALYASKGAGRKCSHYHDGKRCLPIGTVPSSGSPDDSDRPATKQGQKENAPSDEDCPRTEEEILALASIVSTNVTAARPTPPPLTSPPDHDCQVDNLTGLPVLAELMDNLRRRLAEKRRYDLPLSLVTFQLDDVERIVELGGQAPEFVIDAIARIIKAASRKMDLVARCGRAEFVIMLPNCAEADAISPAERIRKAVASCDKLKHGGSAVRFTVSVGVAEASDADNESLLFERAEAAARQATARGANRTFVHNGSMCEPVLAAVLV
jgi:diguanylate cyclase